MKLLTPNTPFFLMESLIRHQSQRLRGGWIPERNGVSGVTNDYLRNYTPGF